MKKEITIMSMSIILLFEKSFLCKHSHNAKDIKTVIGLYSNDFFISSLINEKNDRVMPHVGHGMPKKYKTGHPMPVMYKTNIKMSMILMYNICFFNMYLL